jgi:opacity protein-like surface antigen
MLRKTGLFVAALTLLALIPNAHAAQGDWRLSILGGVAEPMGDFSKKLLDGGLGAKLGFGVGATVDYMVSNQFSLGLDGSYAKNGLNDEEMALLRGISSALDFKYTQMGGTLNIKYWLPVGEGPTSVYMVGGAGFTHFKAEASVPQFSSSMSEDKFLGYGGIGVGYDISKSVAIGLQSDFSFVTLTDVTAPSFGVRAGFMFDFPRGEK